MYEAASQVSRPTRHRFHLRASPYRTNLNGVKQKVSDQTSDEPAEISGRATSSGSTFFDPSEFRLVLDSLDSTEDDPASASKRDDKAPPDIIITGPVPSESEEATSDNANQTALALPTPVERIVLIPQMRNFQTTSPIRVIGRTPIRKVYELLRDITFLAERLKCDAFGEHAITIQQATVASVLDLYRLVTEVEQCVHRQVSKVQPWALPPLVMVPPSNRKVVLSYLRMLLFMLPLYIKRMTDLFHPRVLESFPLANWAALEDTKELERIRMLLERLKTGVRTCPQDPNLVASSNSDQDTLLWLQKLSINSDAPSDPSNTSLVVAGSLPPFSSSSDQDSIDMSDSNPHSVYSPSLTITPLNE